MDITRNQSPLVITNNQNVREFISAKVGCATYSYAWGGLNLVLLCPKREQTLRRRARDVVPPPGNSRARSVDCVRYL